MTNPAADPAHPDLAWHLRRLLETVKGAARGLEGRWGWVGAPLVWLTWLRTRRERREAADWRRPRRRRMTQDLTRRPLTTHHPSFGPLRAPNPQGEREERRSAAPAGQRVPLSKSSPKASLPARGEGFKVARTVRKRNRFPPARE